MRDLLEQTVGLTSPVVRNLVVSAVVVGVVVGLRFLVLRLIHQRIDDPVVWYRARKVGSVVTLVVLVLVLGRIWLPGFDALVTYLGLVSAGIAIALGDLLKNLAGWLYIVTRRPLRIGDRVEIGDHAGDVVDIRAFRFSLLEIRNWVDADQSTGRILHVPNGQVFTQTLANFGAGFQWIWHEIPVLVTFESNWRKAEELLREILDEHAPDLTGEAARASLREAARRYLISYTHLTPTVYRSVRASGVLLTGRVLCDMRGRRGLSHAIWGSLLDAFAAAPDVELAYPTTRAYLADPIRWADEGGGTPPGAGPGP